MKKTCKMTLSNFGWLLFVTFLYCFLSNVDANEIKIKQGKLKGAVLESRNGTKFFAFLGIPYAKPPIGNLRFKSPQEPDSWNDVRDATTPPPVCVQKQMWLKNNSTKLFIEGQEDCLYINVYTPDATEKATLPVMVWIYGGAFLIGDGYTYQPDYILDAPVVLVTFNYRLGPLGFFSVADEILPGNYGMKDQVAALKWVKQNIAAFGGNPNAVTIFGESAGAASVHLHMHSPLSKGLFQRAIAQSGSALSNWAVASPDVVRERAHAFGILSGCPVKSTQALAECLRNIPAKEFFEIHDKFRIWNMIPLVVFPIVIEPRTVVDAFLHENPWKQNEISNDIPFIIGITSAEGAMNVGPFLLENGKLATDLNDHYKRYFPLMFAYCNFLSNEKCIEITESLKQFYFGNKKIGISTANQLEKLFTDGYFAINIMEAALLHKGKTYFYVYDHKNKWSAKDVFGNFPDDLGVPHSDDLASLFPSVFSLPNVTTGADLEVSQKMLHYWINFAKTGNPNGEMSVWEPLKSEAFEYLRITTTEDKMESHLFDDRYKFWKSLNVQPQYSAKDFYKAKDEF